MSDLELDLKTIQDVVDLGPYHLVRCKACREVNLAGRSVRCGWCSANLKTGVRTAAAQKAVLKIERCSRRGPSGPRPRDAKPRARGGRRSSKQSG